MIVKSLKLKNFRNYELLNLEFVLKGQDMFKCILGIMTDTPGMYKDFLNR